MGKLQSALLGQIWTFFVNDLGQTIRGAWRRRGFKNYELITGQLRCQGPTGGFNVRKIRGLIRKKRCRHRDDIGISSRSICRGCERAGLYRALDEVAQLGFYERN